MSPTPRATREAETRTRRRRSPDTEGRGRLYVDERDIPPGMELKWVRETFLGQHDPDNVQANMEDDWSPVSAKSNPNLAPPSLPGAPETGHDLIRRGGQILMQRPKEYGDEDRAILAKKNADALAAVDSDRRSDPKLFDGRNTRPLGENASENAATISRGRFADA